MFLTLEPSVELNLLWDSSGSRNFKIFLPSKWLIECNFRKGNLRRGDAGSFVRANPEKQTNKKNQLIFSVFSDYIALVNCKSNCFYNEGIK